MSWLGRTIAGWLSKHVESAQWGQREAHFMAAEAHERANEWCQQHEQAVAALSKSTAQYEAKIRTLNSLINEQQETIKRKDEALDVAAKTIASLAVGQEVEGGM